MKNLFIAEKPSVAQQFADALGVTAKRKNGYIEDDSHIITWCVGHLITMSYPEKYDERLKRWSLDTLPFLPDQFLYEIIDNVKPQFEIVKNLLNREDVGCIYICTDSGREGEYIYRLVDRMAGVSVSRTRRRVWIDSQTQEEILRGIREAKDWSEYDSLSESAYLRAKEDYLMGINFSRILTLKYGNSIGALMKQERCVISVGRVMSCVLGMVVTKERSIREFVKTPFYRVVCMLSCGTGPTEPSISPAVSGTAPGTDAENPETSEDKRTETPKPAVIEAEWRSPEELPHLYKDNGFLKKEDAEAMSEKLKAAERALLIKNEKKKEIKNPPLLYNLAEIQNDCSKRFRISPDETLKIIQDLYERKLVTYPRTDARVLSGAVAKEIGKNLSGISKLPQYTPYTQAILDSGSWKKIGSTRYTNDAQITDHYAIIPTGQGFGALKSLDKLSADVYDLIVRRFLSIFYPSAIYEKLNLEFAADGEHLFASCRVLKEKGFLEVLSNVSPEKDLADSGILFALKRGTVLPVADASVKEGETSPPKRYTSGSMILAMENAGQLIEDEELRAQIKGSGIGTSATRAEILKKLVTIKYLQLNNKTQVITPTIRGEMVFEVIDSSMKQMLNPELTASWEKGLSYVSEGTIRPEEYMEKLNDFIRRRVMNVKNTPAGNFRQAYEKIIQNY